MDALSRLWRFLFDFSAAEHNRQEVETIVQAALLLSQGDADFLPALNRVLCEWEDGRAMGRQRYFNFLRFMGQYKRPEDGREQWRRRAEHLLEDLPRIYKSPPLEKPEKPEAQRRPDPDRS